MSSPSTPFHLRPVSTSDSPTASSSGSSPTAEKGNNNMRTFREGDNSVVLRDLDLDNTVRGKFPHLPAPPTGHDLMAMFPPAAPSLILPNRRTEATSGYFHLQERAYFAQAGKEIIRVRVDVDVRDVPMDVDERKLHDDKRHLRNVEIIARRDEEIRGRPSASSSQQQQHISPRLTTMHSPRDHHREDIEHVSPRDLHNRQPVPTLRRTRMVRRMIQQTPENSGSPLRIILTPPFLTPKNLTRHGAGLRHMLNDGGLANILEESLSRIERQISFLLLNQTSLVVARLPRPITRARSLNERQSFPQSVPASFPIPNCPTHYHTTPSVEAQLFLLFFLFHFHLLCVCVCAFHPSIHPSTHTSGCHGPNSRAWSNKSLSPHAPQRPLAQPHPQSVDFLALALSPSPTHSPTHSHTCTYIAHHDFLFNLPHFFLTSLLHPPNQCLCSLRLSMLSCFVFVFVPPHISIQYSITFLCFAMICL